MTATNLETPADRAASQIKREDRVDAAQAADETGLPERTACRCGSPMERDAEPAEGRGTIVTYTCRDSGCDRRRYFLVHKGRVVDSEWGGV